MLDGCEDFLNPVLDALGEVLQVQVLAHSERRVPVPHFDFDWLGGFFGGCFGGWFLFNFRYFWDLDVGAFEFAEKIKHAKSLLELQPAIRQLAARTDLVLPRFAENASVALGFVVATGVWYQRTQLCIVLVLDAHLLQPEFQALNHSWHTREDVELAAARQVVSGVEVLPVLILMFCLIGLP